MNYKQEKKKVLRSPTHEPLSIEIIFKFFLVPCHSVCLFKGRLMIGQCKQTNMHGAKAARNNMFRHLINPVKFFVKNPGKNKQRRKKCSHESSKKAQRTC